MAYVNLILRSLFIILLCVSPVFAASISITPSGDSSYSVQGAGLINVAGIQLNIGYDAASLSTPTVTPGGLVSGALPATNTSIPGLIKIALISTKAFSGSGSIATISFASKPGIGGITSANVSMIDSNGAQVLASVSFSNPPGSSVQDPSTNAGLTISPTSTTPATTTTGTISTATTAAPTTSNTTYAGTITLPTDFQQRVETKPALPSTPIPAPVVEPAAAIIAEQSQTPDKPAADAKPEETLQYIVYMGIKEKFRQYNGSKKLSDIAALFDKKVAQTINQEPAILLSNGQSKAILTIDIPAKISYSPNFAVNGGKLVSCKQENQVKWRWLVEVLPEAGSGKVTMTIIAGAEEFEYPLTVAPPAKTALTLDESGWNIFLREVGTAEAPLHDLNNDGVRDYIDEYIFIANYLSNKAAAKSAAAAADQTKTTAK